MKLSQLKKVTYEEIKNKQYEKLRETMGEDIELYFKESGQFIGYQEMEMDSKYLDVHEDISYLKDSVSLHSHIFYEILFCRSGNIQYLIGDMRYQLQPNDIIFVPPGVSHRPIFGEQFTEPYLRTALWVSADYWKRCSEELNAVEWEENKEHQEKSYIIRTNGTVLYQFQKIFEELLREEKEGKPGAELFSRGLFLQLICLLYRSWKGQTMTELKSEKAALLDEIISYIEKHFAEEISLKTIAAHFLISESAIGQLFKKQMDVSFYKIVTQRRLIEAKKLIVEGVLLKSIPELCGFSDYSVFYKAFVKEYGISPKEFRTMVRGEQYD